MKKLKFISILSVLIFFASINNANAQTELNHNEKTDTFFEKGVKITTDNFTGTAFLKMLVTNDAENPITVGNVTFEPGARTKWHLHPGGQILLVTDGVGYYQEKGQPKKILHKRDVIKCPPNIEHWHGASVDSYFSHLAIGNSEKKVVVWLRAVSDEEYKN